jgi:hypothetical protein
MLFDFDEIYATEGTGDVGKWWKMYDGRCMMEDGWCKRDDGWLWTTTIGLYLAYTMPQPPRWRLQAPYVVLYKREPTMGAWGGTFTEELMEEGWCKMDDGWCKMSDGRCMMSDGRWMSKDVIGWTRMFIVDFSERYIFAIVERDTTERQLGTD